MTDLSIVIPAFNAEPYLAETLGSCLNVRPAPAEIFVVDDGSTDGTAAVCAGFGDRIRYCRVQNGGVSKARNIGAAATSGRWILFLDADDQLEADGPVALIEAAERCQAGTAYGLVQERRQPPSVPRTTGQNHAEGEPPLPAVRNYWRCAVITPGSAVIRREVHAQLGGFVPGYEPMEDRDYWIKAGLLTSCAHVNQVVLDKTWRPVSAGKMDARRIWNGLRSRLALPAWCQDHGLAWPEGLPRDDRMLLEKAVNEAVWCKCWGVLGALLDECRRRGIRTFWTVKASLEFAWRGGARRHPAPVWVIPLGR